MAITEGLLAIIGRFDPAIYDAIFPRGPLLRAVPAHRLARFGGGEQVELNPQPLPPREVVAGILTGIEVGHELVRGLGFAQAFGLELRLDIEDLCPPPPTPPWPFGPQPDPWLTHEDRAIFDYGYAIGLGAVLEATSPVWQSLPAADFAARLHEVAAEQVAQRQR